MQKLLLTVDKISTFVGHAFSWLIVALTLLITWEVFSRYALDHPHPWAFDAMIMMYGTLIMMAGAYTLAKSGHVRGDVLYGFFQPRTQATPYSTTTKISVHATTGARPGISGSTWQMAAAIPAVSQRSPDTGPIRRLSPTPRSRGNISAPSSPICARPEGCGWPPIVRFGCPHLQRGRTNFVDRPDVCDRSRGDDVRR